MNYYYETGAAITYGDLTSTDATYYSGNIIYGYGESLPTQVVKSVKIEKPETEVEWLRRRVDEMCWKQAA